MKTCAMKKTSKLVPGSKLRVMHGALAGEIGTIVPAPCARMGGIFARFGQRTFVLEPCDVGTLYALM